METKLTRIAQIAKQRPKEVFTSLYHLLNENLLTQCHRELKGNKAAGIDHITKEEYEQNLAGNIANLVNRLKNHSYKPQPVRRTYIPKGNGKEVRPLGIPSYEDKIVQMGLNKILQAIYETEFMEFSYGFRPNRSCHDALRELNRIIHTGKINYIVDADIRKFFDTVDHEWMIKFLKLRIADPNINRLITKFMKSGCMEEGQLIPTDVGTPQGSIVSPTLGNIYLHYVLDLWFVKVVKKRCKGQAEIVRYADDSVFCFQYKEDAEWFYKELIQRLEKFKLKVAEEKTKIIIFGKYAEERCKAAGLNKPETFDFLGFMHYCGRSVNGKFRLMRKTSKKKFKAKVQEFKQWIKASRNLKISEIFRATSSKLIGHYQYYGITDNMRMLSKFLYNIQKLLYKWLNRRSQRKSFSLDKFNLYLKINPLPKPRIYASMHYVGASSVK